jgi:Leucine-rich repeat (LRR) protein
MVRFDETRQGRPIVEAVLRGNQVTNAALAHIEGLAQLQRLNLRDSNVTNAGLEHLKGLTKLKTLTLGITKVTDAGIGDLEKALPNCGISR